MQLLDGRFVYAASDLNDYLECRRLTELEALVARHSLVAPQAKDDRAALVRRKGEEHEHRHLERLKGDNREELVEFGRLEAGIESYREADAATLEAMQRGARTIYQATFFDETFLGRADFLRRVPVPSPVLGDYSYEIVDTKLALATKGYFLVQLCNYSEHLARLQGVLPVHGHIILGNGEEERYRLSDYMAYYRHLKDAFLRYASGDALSAIETPRRYPLKVPHCKYCAWDAACEAQRRADDHLGFVAWMRNDQIAKLETAGVSRLGALAQAADLQRPAGMSVETFARLRRQASLQVAARQAQAEPGYELLPYEPALGFALLPAPATGDVFFDMEGDPLFQPARGLEYLFGCWMPDDDEQYRAFWGTDRAAERQAFERTIDFIVERRHKFPLMHVYHYASYEKSALRRLAQEHGTREEEVDDLLRGEVFVDLFTVVRQALMISEEKYGLKNLEVFYRLNRKTATKKGDDSILMFERWLIEPDQLILDDIEAYNRDDCRSTYLLREWLLARRAQAAAQFGVDLPWLPVKAPDDPCHTEFVESCTKCQKRRREERENARHSELERALLPPLLPQSEQEYETMQPAARISYLMGALLAYHRREERPAWWEYFDRREGVDELLEFDRAAIGGLRLVAEVPPAKSGRSFVYTYAFPDQQHKMEPGDAEDPRATRPGINVSILRIDEDQNLLELKTTAPLERARQITELIPSKPFPTAVQRRALEQIAEALRDGRLRDEHPATFDLLAGGNPRVAGVRTIQPERVNAAEISAVTTALEQSYVFVQGPPGSGKSTVGSKVISDLLERGARVAVTSTSHTAIHNILHKVEACMDGRGKAFAGRYKHSKLNGGSRFESHSKNPSIASMPENEDFYGTDYQLAGGTSWLFAREELRDAFDYLFIDEAGQVSLADALAMSLCARNVVLLGDPSQLAQVGQGRQPLHAGDSVLQHLLGEHQTVPRDRGIFLDVSYRMHPQICSFVSKAMYDGRLHAAGGTDIHRVDVGGDTRAGLYFASIEHTGNSASSEQEADYIVAQIAVLRARGQVTDSWPPDWQGVQREIADRDVIVVTPYNAQRRLILRKLREAGIGVRVGTVDKFQGQEAAVVFYSMATSTGEDLPRNMGFLFDRNRFNVAISRARAASVLVCSPRLLDIRCRTAEQMSLVNLLCAFDEESLKWSDLRESLVPPVLHSGRLR